MINKLTTVLCALMPLAAVAHHDISADINLNSPIEIAGELVDVDWGTPHTVLRIEVGEESGPRQVWLIEADSTAELGRRVFNSSAVFGIERVSIIAYQSLGVECADECQAYGVSLTDDEGNSYTLSREINDRLRELLSRDN